MTIRPDPPRASAIPSMLPPPELTMDFLVAIIDHLAHPVFVKDREYRFVLLNHACCEMVGHPRERMIGRTDYDFFPRKESDYFRACDAEVFTRGETLRIVEEAITDASGERHVLTTTKAPLRAADGTITHLVGIIHDITTLKRAEEALRHVNEDLERRVSERTAALEAAQAELMRRERLAVVGQLAGGLAHQIRNPLASIKNAAYLLRLALGQSTDPDVDRSLVIIGEEVKRANQIITDLLDYARVRPPEIQAVSFGYVLDQALGGLVIPERVAVVREVPDGLTVRGDPGQLQTALFNLLRYSIEAMPDGGTLTLSTVLDDAHCRVTLADTGDGFTEDVRDHIFEPLPSERSVTHGLHLVTARALIENQSGALEIDSRPHEGTRFTLRLPLFQVS